MRVRAPSTFSMRRSHSSRTQHPTLIHRSESRRVLTQVSNKIGPGIIRPALSSSQGGRVLSQTAFSTLRARSSSRISSSTRPQLVFISRKRGKNWIASGSNLEFTGLGLLQLTTLISPQMLIREDSRGRSPQSLTTLMQEGHQGGNLILEIILESRNLLFRLWLGKL